MLMNEAWTQENVVAMVFYCVHIIFTCKLLNFTLFPACFMNRMPVRFETWSQGKKVMLSLSLLHTYHC